MAASFSQDSSRVLLVGGVDGDATLWDVRSRKLLSVLSRHRGSITTGMIRKDGLELLTAREDGSIRLWRNGWLDLREYFRASTTATLTPDQRMLLLGESETEALQPPTHSAK